MPIGSRPISPNSWAIRSKHVEIEQFPQGFSNLTYLVRCGSDEYVLRRPPFGNQVKSAHDMGREFNVLSKLSRVYELAPEAGRVLHGRIGARGVRSI